MNGAESVTPIITSFEMYFEDDNDADINKDLPQAEANHSTVVQSGLQRDTSISDAMDSFPLCVGIEVDPIEKKRNTSENIAPREAPVSTATTETPKQVHLEPAVNILCIQ